METVRRGQVIGTVGSTGVFDSQGRPQPTWVHLHFGLATLSFQWLNPYNDYWTTNPPSYSSPSDPNDGRMISSGQTLNGTINPANDEDTYYFDASQGQLATIRMNRTGGNLDSYLYLYDPYGSLVNNPSADDDRGGNHNALIDRVTLPHTGRYLIRARSYVGSSSGPYSLGLTMSGGGQPPAAPSNTTARALDSSRILVEWNDNSTNEDGFVINDRYQDFGTPPAFPGTGRGNFTVGGLAPGTYKCFRVRAFNAAGSSGWSNDGCTTTPNTTCPYYRAEYYSNRRDPIGSPTFVQCEGWPIDHKWDDRGPGNGVGNDNFSARWTGRAYIAAGTYTFISGSDDGIKVWLDGNVIIDRWYDQGYSEYRVTRSVSGGDHNIEVRYYENTGAARVFFKWEQAVSSYYRLTAKHSGKCLDVYGAYRNDGAQVIQWDCHGGDNQRWNLVPAGGYYKIVAKHSGKCLDVSQASRNNGAQIIQWDCHGGDNQLWSLVSAGSYYKIVAKHSGKCLDVDRASRNSGARVIQWDCRGGDNQLWQRTSVGAGQDQPTETDEVPQEPTPEMEIQLSPIEPELEPTPSP